MDNAARFRPGADLRGVLITPMHCDGLETIIGMQRDAVFGPMVMSGLGGVMVDLLKGVVFASAPVSPAAALRLVNSVHGSALLEGWRGAPPVDKQALVDAICHVGRLSAAHDSLQSIEINPFLVSPGGGVALDALVVNSAQGAKPQH